MRSFHLLRCLHEAYGVGTIPLADISRETWKLERAVGRGGAPYAVIALSRRATASPARCGSTARSGYLI